MTLPDETPPAPVAGRRRFAITPVRALAALTALAAVAALFFGVRLVLTVNSGDLDQAAGRDSVLIAAQQAAINLNTLDSAKVDAGLDLWEETSTGATLDEFKSHRAEYAKVVTDAKRSTQATVVDAAVSQLDLKSGTARAIVGIDVKVTPEGQQPVVTRQRLLLEMSRTPEGWKVSRLSPVRPPTS